MLRKFINLSFSAKVGLAALTMPLVSAGSTLFILYRFSLWPCFMGIGPGEGCMVLGIFQAPALFPLIIPLDVISEVVGLGLRTRTKWPLVLQLAYSLCLWILASAIWFLIGVLVGKKIEHWSKKWQRVILSSFVLVPILLYIFLFFVLYR